MALAHTPPTDPAAFEAWLETLAPVSEDDAARLSHLSTAKLRASRLARPRCDGPPYIRVGRQVRYLPIDIHRWLLSRRVVPATMREANR